MMNSMTAMTETQNQTIYLADDEYKSSVDPLEGKDLFNDDLFDDQFPADVQNTMPICLIDVSEPHKAHSGMVRLAEDITLDSGAGASVGNGNVLFPQWKLEESAGSKRGLNYVGAGGELLHNEGERSGKLMFENSMIANTRWQGAGSRKPLLVASDVEDMGNVILFAKQGSMVVPESDPIGNSPKLEFQQ